MMMPKPSGTPPAGLFSGWPETAQEGSDILNGRRFPRKPGRETIDQYCSRNLFATKNRSRKGAKTQRKNLTRRFRDKKIATSGSAFGEEGQNILVHNLPVTFFPSVLC